MLFPFISPNTKCPVALGRYLWYKSCRLDLSFNAGSCHRSFEEHNDIKSYHVSCWSFCFYGPWTSPFTSPLYIYIYRCIWHWQQYNIVYVYTYYIYTYIHIYRMLYLYAHYLSPFGNCHWSSTWGSRHFRICGAIACGLTWATYRHRHCRNHRQFS